MHRDIKPANVFLDRRGNLVLGDFGLAAFCGELQAQDRRVEFCGTMEYLSRDVWQGRQYSPASDVWAYGAVVFEMAVGRVSGFPSVLVEVVLMSDTQRMWDSSKCKSHRHAKDKAIGGSLREFLGKDKIPRVLEFFLDEVCSIP